jgi:DNA-binding NtrC family response regulator
VQIAPSAHPVVLVVDDEPLIVTLLKTALEQQGISTATAASAGEACQTFSAHHASIKVLVSDVIMPETNGIELAQRFLKTQPRLTVIFISGYCAMHETALKGFECFSKPFKTDELVRRVRSLIERAPNRAVIAGIAAKP